MSKKVRKNHTVQKARIDGFATKVGNNHHVNRFLLRESKGGFSNTDTTFVVKGFYPDDLENKLSIFENRVMVILKKIRTGDNFVVLSRREVDDLKKYITIQICRTESTIRVFLSTYKSDPLSIILKDNHLFPGEELGVNEIKQYSLDIIDELTTMDWNNLGNSKFCTIRYLFNTLDGFYPMIVKTYEEEFILGDPGLSIDQCSFTPPIISDVSLLFENTYGISFSKGEIQKTINNNPEWINFINFPLSKDTSILFVDDFWRAIFYTDIRNKGLFGITSVFLSKYNIPPVVIYKKDVRGLDVIRNPFSVLKKKFTEDDEINTFVVGLDSYAVAYLNACTILQSREIVFNNRDNLKSAKLVCKRLFDDGCLDADLSRIDNINFGIEYSKSKPLND